MHPGLHLQRTIGNQAVGRLLKTEHKSIESHPVSSTQPHFQYYFGQMPVFAANLKNLLTVNAQVGYPGPGDNPGVQHLVQLARQEPLHAQSYDQRISPDLFEKVEAGQLPSGVNFKASASDLPTADDIMGKEGVKYFTYGFRWVQTVITNEPLPGVGPESIDGEARKGVEPYYNKYSLNEKGPGDFEDWPSRTLSGNSPLEWKATLALVGVEPKNNWLEAYDIRTYGFKLTPDISLTSAQLAAGQKPFHKVDPIYPKQDWSAFLKHRSIVKAAFPNWDYSLLKAKSGAAKGAFFRQMEERSLGPL